MKIIIIIQARMGSTRLPGKVLKPLDKQDVLTYTVKRCQAIEGVDRVVVATSNLPQDDLIVEWCNSQHVEVYRGSEENVLERYIQCAEHYNPDYVMRVTADCPFVDYELAAQLVKSLQDEPVEIIDLIGEMPRGLAVEMISYEALKRIYQFATEKRHLEHVTYYAYEYPEQFTRKSFNVPLNRQEPHLRITLDTVEDYEMLKRVAVHFQDPLISSVQVIHYLKQHPEIAHLNDHIQQKAVQ